MSGLLERIARRRRASASSRLSAYAALSLPAEETGGESTSTSNGHDSGGHANRAVANGLAAGANGHHANGNANGAAKGVPAAPWLAIAAAQAVVSPPTSEELRESAGELQESEPPTQLEQEVTAEDEETQPQPENDAAPASDDAIQAAEEEVDPARAGLLERGRIRRRVLYLRALRELQLRDLGGFMLELHRYGAERPQLVAAKLESAALVDAELRELEGSLGVVHAPGEIRAAGIGGACEQCGAVHGSADRFCANCGTPLTGQQQTEADPPLLASSAGAAAVDEGRESPGAPVADTLPDEA